MRRSPFIAFIFIAALAVASPGFSGERRVAQSDLIPGLYLESTGFATHIEAPAVEGFGIYTAETFGFGDPVSLGSDEGRVDEWGAGWEGRLGFQLPYGPEGWSLELGGSYARAESEGKSNLRFDDSDVLMPVFVDGRPGLAFGGGFDQTIVQRFDGDVQIWDVRLGAAMDYEVSDFFTGKLRAGLVGGMLEQEYDISHRTNEVGPFFFSLPGYLRSIPTMHRLEEDLDANFAGPYLGASLDVQLTERISVSLETDVAFLYMWSEFHASQEFNLFAFDFGGSFCAIDPFNNCHFNKSDREGAFSARPRIRAGIDFDLGPFVLGVHGGATYYSYAPQVVNPQLRNLDDDGFAGSDEAHISGDDLLIGDVGVRLTIPFGGDGMTSGSSASAFGTAAGQALASIVPGLYFESAGYAAHVDVPDVEGFGLVQADFGGNPLRDDLPDDEGEIQNWGGGWEGLLGFRLPGGGEGSPWSLEFGGSYVTADASLDDFMSPGNNDVVIAVPINGQQRIAFLSAEHDLRQSFDGEIQVWDTRMGVARDLDLLGSLRSRLRLGVVGGISEQQYVVEHDVTELDIPPPPLFVFAGLGGNKRIDEEVKDRFVGPYIGLDLEHQLTNRISLSLDTEVALMYSWSRFKATERTVANTFSLAAPFGPGGACDAFGPAMHPVTKCTFEYEASDESSNFVARPRMRAGIDFDLGPFVLGITGGVTYYSYASQIVNSDHAQPIFGGPPQFDEAELDDDDLLISDVGIQVTIPLR